MKYASVSVFGSFLLIVMFTSMWPDASRIRPLAKTVASDMQVQEKKLKRSEEDVFSKSVNSDRKPQKSAIRSRRPVNSSERKSINIDDLFKLQDSYTSNEITETKLQYLKVKGFGDDPISFADFIDIIQRKYHIRVVIGRSLIEDVGLDPDSLEVVCHNDIRLIQALQDVLNNMPSDETVDFAIIDGTIHFGIAEEPLLQTVQVLDLGELLENTEISKDELGDVYHEIIVGSDNIGDGNYPVKWLGEKLVLKHSGSIHMKFKNLLRRFYPDFEKNKREKMLSNLYRSFRSERKSE